MTIFEGKFKPNGMAITTKTLKNNKFAITKIKFYAQHDGNNQRKYLSTTGRKITQVNTQNVSVTKIIYSSLIQPNMALEFNSWL